LDIVAVQADGSLLFGEAAVALGLLAQEDIDLALACQYSYPCMENTQATLSSELLVINDPFSPQVEVFRSIRSRLLQSDAGKSIRTIGVISAGDAEGKTLMAANLAVVFAQLGAKTLLIDLNFRRPRVHEIFNLRNNVGASSLFIKRVLFSQAVQKTQIPTLDVLPSGPMPPNPIELLSWQETGTIIEAFKTQYHYDIIIMDTPAFLKTADATVISALCDATLLVAQKGKTKQCDFEAVKKILSRAGVSIIGAVVNEMRNNGKR